MVFRVLLSLTYISYNKNGVDVKLSKELSTEFKQNTKQEHPPLAIGLNVLILGMNSWPQTPPDTQFLLPESTLR